MSFIVYNIELYNSRTNERINSATNKLNNSQSQQPIALNIYLWIEAFLFSPWVIMRQYLMVGITLLAPQRHHWREFPLGTTTDPNLQGRTALCDRWR